MKLNRVLRADRLVPIRTALVSVADKRGLEELVRGLSAACPGLTIYSTGGTFHRLREILEGEKNPPGLRQVSDYTGHPEMQGGLVKTLDYRIYLGLLAETYNPDHRRDLKDSGAVPIDLVAANLYPFREAAARAGADIEDARTHIDIGGPAMLRAAAKNYLRVAALCDPGDYPGVLEELRARGGGLDLSTRFRLAKKVFRHTAAYDDAVAAYFEGRRDDEPLEKYEP